MVAFLLMSVAVQAAYMAVDGSGITNWEIAYHASNYALVAAVAYDQSEKVIVYGGRFLLRCIAAMWGYFMLAELSYINSTYEFYAQQINNDIIYYQLGYVLGAAVLLIGMDLIKKIL